MKLSNFNLLDDENDDKELNEILESFNNTSAAYPKKSIVQILDEQCLKTPDNIALVFGKEKITYRELDERTNRYAGFLISQGTKKGDIVGLLFDKSVEMIYAMLGVAKAGGVYLPMDPEYPFDRLKFVVEDSRTKIIMSSEKYIKVLNKLQWECAGLQKIACADSADIHEAKETLNELMKPELWDYITEQSHDDISGGGWTSSYTGEDISRKEMDEYAENIYSKLSPFLNKNTKVLEIGCSSGISMMRISPEIKSYYGTDLSPEAVKRTQQRVEEKGFRNIIVEALPAHEIDKVKDSGFDVIIINSVIQLFNGHNYLRDVIKKSISLLSDKGIIFLGDLQDQDKKYELIESLKTFQKENVGKGFHTKTDWSNELFISKDFLNDLQFENEQIQQVSCSEKIYTIKNELTEFRFDAILSIDKTQSNKTILSGKTKHKQQLGLSAFKSSGKEKVSVDLLPADLLYIIYTSGSTGRPKGCKISHENVVRLMINDRHDFDFSASDVWIMAHAYYFDFSVWEMYGALLFGGKLIIPATEEIKDVSKLYQLVKTHKVSVLNQTPLAFNFFIEEELRRDEHTLQEHLRYVVFGGDKLDPRKLAPWAELYDLNKIKLINMYGITETTVHVTYYQITKNDLVNKGVSPIGRPLPETKVYVLNDKLKPLPIGITGEMYVGGTGVCKGYLNRDELTAERFIKNPFAEGEMLYKTGDQARWLEGGTLEYQGRIDFQVKIRGYRIELGEVESVLNSFPLIKKAVVTAFEKDGQNELIAYVVSDDSLEVKTLREFMKVQLSDFMIPSHFVRIDEIPLTSNGKLDKKALPDPYKSALGGGEKYLAPENETQQVIADVWSEVLGVEKVGINDNFFSIGGDSLKAIRVIVKLNKQLNSQLKVSHIFNHQTVAQLAAQVSSVSSGSSAATDFETGSKKIREIRTYIEENSKELLPGTYEDIYPLTSIEKGMIFSSMLRPEEPVYYDQFTYDLEIKSIDVFRKAFELMVQKHPVLRSEYYMNSFIEPVKVQLPHIKLPLDFQDLSAMNEKRQEEIINEYLKKDVDARLDFEGDILWHLKAFLLKDRQFYVVWSVHHAIMDGWSESSFVAEFANLCADPALMDIQKLPELKSTYKDYTAINIGRQNSGAAIAFWKEHLDGYSRNKLPFNLSGKRISDELGMKRVGKYFSDELSAGIEELRSRLGVTSKAVCLAANAYLMHIITSEKDVVSGVVSNDRPEIEDGDKILGCFLNTIPFRVNFENIRNYSQLISYFSDYLNKVKQHEIYLLDIAHAAGERSASGNPLFDCIFNFTDFHILEEIAEKNAALSYSDAASSNFEISQNNLMTNTLFDVEMDKTHGRLSIGIKYALSYFTEADVRYAIELYENILKAFIKDVESELNTADLLTEKDRNWLLYEFNNTTIEYPSGKLMHQLFEEQAAKTPGHVALTQHGKKISYKELNETSSRLAHFLIEKGVKSGDNVGVIADRNFNMIISLMAVLKAGGAYVPVDPSYPGDRQEYILTNSNAKIVLTDHEYEIIKQDPSKNYFNLNTLNLSGYSSENIDLKKSSKDLAYTIYTSGSTGRPKGVMIEHHSAVNLINWVNKTYNINRNDRLLFITSMCFDLSVYDIFGMLAAGGTIVIATQDEVKDPDTLQNIMIAEGITFWDSVPTTMNYLVDMIEGSGRLYKQNDLRLVFMSGDWIPVTLPSKIKKYFPNAVNISLGGATEGTVWSNYYPIEHVIKNQISIPYGKPIDNNFFYILDDKQNPVPKGVTGELYIGGVGVAAGYANDEEKTNAAFFKDPFARIPNSRMYKTGDLGRMMPDGNMEFLGRKDFQVKIRGFRVELGEIENQLQKHPAVQRAIVLAKEDIGNTKFLCAYVVTKSELNMEELKHHLAKELPDYMIPGIFIRIDKVPMTSNGKIDRNALPDPAAHLEKKVVEEPQEGLEQNIAAIWKGILGLEKIGRNENIFELGAHSLHAGGFVSRLNKSLGFSLNLRDLFSNPTIELQANVLKSGKKNGTVKITRVAPAEHYPVSHSQRRLWVIDQIEEGQSAQYNLPANYRITGALDLQAFEKAFQKVIDRHEILRTSFITVNAEPRQLIQDKLRFKLDVVETGDQKKTEEFILENSFTPFDLKTAPLFRIKLIRNTAAENDFVISFVMHHIISDGWSMGVMMNEVFNYYNAFSKAENVEMEELPVQYKDFSGWQNQLIENDLNSVHGNYWKQKMSGEIPVLEMPLKGSRPLMLNYEGDRIEAAFDEQLTKKIKEYCLKQEVSTFMFLQGVLKVLLYRYTGQNDLIVGSPIAGREHADLAGQIGFYVNTLALRDQLDPQQPFSHFLKNVKNTVLDAFEHQVYPYDKLVDDLGLQRDLNRNPLFDIMLVMQNVDESKAADEIYFNEVAENLNITRISSGKVQSKFDLTFNFFESEKIILGLEYSTELFEKQFVERLWQHFKMITEAVIEQPALSIRELDIITAAERNFLFSINEQSKENYPDDKTITEIFEKVAAENGERDAVITRIAKFSFTQINQNANGIAKELIRAGVKPGDVVACLLPRSPELISALFGILKAGAVYLPIDIVTPPDRVEFILADSSAKMLITSKENNYQTVSIDPAMVPSERTFAAVKRNPADPAYVIYTSGSTGRPKGVVVAHTSAVNLALAQVKILGMHPNSRMLLFSSPAFDASVGEIFYSLLNNASLVVCEEEAVKDPHLFYDLVENTKATVATLTPAFINLLDETKLRSFEAIITCGEPAIPKDVTRFSKVMQVVNGYGPTEATVFASFHVAEKGKEYHSFPIGRPLPNVSLYVVNSQNKLQPLGVPGELCIGGVGVSKGYLNRPDLNADKFIADAFAKGMMYRTGDLVKWSENGYLEYIGRIDNQVKLRGYRIELGEIENVIRAIPEIENVTVQISGEGSERIMVAYYSSPLVLDSNYISGKISEFLAPYMIPSAFIHLEEIPMNANGKVDKKKLPAVDFVKSNEYVAPENEIEEKLVAVWQNILGVGKIGTRDKFFELGGNSLKAIQFINKVSDEFGIRLSVKEIFGKDTIKELSDIVLEKQLEAFADDDDELMELLKE